MADRHLITLGYIPRDCKKERISCGDPAGSGTTEVYLFTDSDSAGEIRCSNGKGVVKMPGEAWWDASHPAWAKIIKTFCAPIWKEQKLDSTALGSC